MYLVLLKVSSEELRTMLRAWIESLRSVARDIQEITNAGREDSEDTIPGLGTDLGLLEGNMAILESQLR